MLWVRWHKTHLAKLHSLQKNFISALSPEKRSTQKKNNQHILDISEPKSAKKLRGFVGMIDHYIPLDSEKFKYGAVNGYTGDICYFLMDKGAF